MGSYVGTELLDTWAYLRRKAAHAGSAVTRASLVLLLLVVAVAVVKPAKSAACATDGGCKNMARASLSSAR